MLCINARNAAKWFCSHFGAKVTPGTETLSPSGRCVHCEKSEPPYEQEPSWLRNDEDE